MGRVGFSIFGRDFQFISEKDDQQTFSDLVSEFQSKIEQLQEETLEKDTIKLLVFFCINLLNENNKLKRELLKVDDVDIEKEIEDIILKIDNLLEK